jgi:hypothetical protein
MTFPIYLPGKWRGRKRQVESIIMKQDPSCDKNRLHDNETGHLQEWFRGVCKIWPAKKFIPDGSNDYHQ